MGFYLHFVYVARNFLNFIYSNGGVSFIRFYQHQIIIGKSYFEFYLYQIIISINL